MRHLIIISSFLLFSFTIISCSEEEEYTEESSTSEDTSTTVVSKQMGGSIQGVELSLSALVTTLAGSGSEETSDGTRTSASFKTPYGITTDGTNLYVAENTESLVRQIVISTGVVTTLAGTGSSGSANGTGTSASFNMLPGITTDGTNLYISDTGNNLIRQIE